MIYLGLAYAATVVGLVWYFLREQRRREEEARVERRELTDRVMALSSKPESLVAVQRSEEPAKLSVVGEDQPWHEVSE